MSKRKHNKISPKLEKKFKDYLKGGGSEFFDIEELSELIEYYYAIDNDKLCGKAIDLALSLHPEHADFHVSKAVHLVVFTSIKDGIKYLEDNLEIGKDYFEYVFLMSELYLEEEDYNRSEGYAFMAMQIEESPRVFNQFADIYYDEHDFEQMEMYLQASLSHEPGNIETLRRYYDLVLTEDESFDRHVDYLYELADNNPLSANNWYYYGVVAFESQDFEGAIKGCEYCLAIDNDHRDALIYLAKSQASLNMQEVYSNIDELIKRSDNDNNLFYNIGEIFSLKGDWEDSIKYYKKSISLNIETISSITRIVRSYMELGDMDTAERYVLDGLERFPNELHLIISYVILLKNTGRDEEADRIASERHNEILDITELKIDFSLMLIDQNKTDKAIEILKDIAENQEHQTPERLMKVFVILSQLKIEHEYTLELLSRTILEFSITRKYIEKTFPSILDHPDYVDIIDKYAK